MGAFLLMYPGRTIMECPKHGSQKNTNQCALSVQQDTLCWCLQSASDSLGVVLPSGLLMAEKKQKNELINNKPSCLMWLLMLWVSSWCHISKHVLWKDSINWSLGKVKFKSCWRSDPSRINFSAHRLLSNLTDWTFSVRDTVYHGLSRTLIDLTPMLICEHHRV